MKITDGPFIREKEMCFSIELGTIENDYYVALNDEIILRDNQINAQNLFNCARDMMIKVSNHIKMVSSKNPLEGN